MGGFFCVVVVELFLCLVFVGGCEVDMFVLECVDEGMVIVVVLVFWLFILEVGMVIDD